MPRGPQPDTTTATAGRVTPHQPQAYVHQMNMIVNSVIQGFLAIRAHGKLAQNPWRQQS
jgi:hypothetical protein